MASNSDKYQLFHHALIVSPSTLGLLARIERRARSLSILPPG